MVINLARTGAVNCKHGKGPILRSVQIDLEQAEILLALNWECNRRLNSHTSHVLHFALRPEFERQSAPKLDVLDAPYIALKNANVRERPDVESTHVTDKPSGRRVSRRWSNGPWVVVLGPLSSEQA